MAELNTQDIDQLAQELIMSQVRERFEEGAATLEDAQEWLRGRQMTQLANIELQHRAPCSKQL